jgi:CheY-like chemotaxis protein
MDAAAARRRGILIVEDDADIRETLQHLLESSGYTARAAGNGQEALEMIESLGHPCLILLDLMMPVMDGWAFLSALECNERLASVPIVIVSAYTDRGVVSERAQQVLQKPVDIHALMEAVREHCGDPPEEEPAP